jgi:hypothetical protein
MIKTRNIFAKLYLAFRMMKKNPFNPYLDYIGADENGTFSNPLFIPIDAPHLVAKTPEMEDDLLEFEKEEASDSEEKFLKKYDDDDFDSEGEEPFDDEAEPNYDEDGKIPFYKKGLNQLKKETEGPFIEE